MFDIAYARRAELDLAEIADFLERKVGDAEAARLFDQMKVHIETLRRNADRLHVRPELGAGRRVLNHHPYLIFYRVDGNTAFILRVLHGARRITPDMIAD